MQVMNTLKGGGSLTAKMALLVYTKDDPLQRGFGTGDAAITVHPVTAGEIGAGSCLDEPTFADLIRRVGWNGQAKIQAREILPPGVLYAGLDRLMWFAPARRDVIWFATGRRDFDAALNGQTVLHPPLVFLARAGNLSVFAVAKNERPEARTPLLLAPYFNLYASGNMCEGNVPLPKTLSVTHIPTWESAFYDTRFTHSNYSGIKWITHPQGHDGFWRDMLRERMWNERLAKCLAPAPFPGDTGSENRRLMLKTVLNQ